MRSRWPEVVSTGLCKRCISLQVERCPRQEERYHMIAEAAYYRAEHRGFQSGNPEQDWLEAENEIDQVYFGTPEWDCPLTRMHQCSTSP